ncbi:methionyl-tRNA formyltransferase [Kibdelosporangium banguiense]|uniref:Methionyl-tRNA formyltransferase n=1 Tax=Kibdelosporangium banguiense TaxID=1365924 RepID=A0ABS4TN41_9PSEU|nr:methionyl-tRNA formyltransferase [Kibdelosporangium banguiense]MBP2325825.1 methionyl-tRNA formyltransferase [Kibdelosporangium banguiense]
MPGYVFATGMEFAAPAVDILCAQGDPPALLIGYPPGLAHRSGYAPLAEASARHRIPLLETADINDGQVLAEVQRLNIDLFVIAGWSQLIREPLLSACPLGAIGLHPSRLPHGRGRAPLPWTIIKGLTTSAVSLFFLKPGVDDGDLIDQVEFPITPRDTVAEVYRKVTEINIALLTKHIPATLRGQTTATPQPSGGSTWPKRRPDDGLIDWTQPAPAVYNWIRALGPPYPGAFTTHNGRRLWLHTADLIQGAALDHGLTEHGVANASLSLAAGSSLRSAGSGLPLSADSGLALPAEAGVAEAAGSDGRTSEIDRVAPAPSSSPIRPGARSPTGRAETPKSGQFWPIVHPIVSPLGADRPPAVPGRAFEAEPSHGSPADDGHPLPAGHEAWPGEVLGVVWSTSVGGVLVRCGGGVVIVREVSWEGGPRTDALALLESGELGVGVRLGVS